VIILQFPFQTNIPKTTSWSIFEVSDFTERFKDDRTGEKQFLLLH
jgi:hypothetical protein